MKFRRFIFLLLIALIAAPAVMAGIVPDDEDYDVSIRKGIRRLHPERERIEAQKRLQEQMSRKATPKEDPWDMTGEVWGTVDYVPTAVKDSTAVEGQRLNTDGQNEVQRLINTDYSIKEYGMGIRRMTWHDEPVTDTRERLMPYFTVTDSGECRSKYVSLDTTSNEVYFAFALSDSVPGPLRLCVQYCADDPLNYDQITFTIDDFDYIFYPAPHPSGQRKNGIYWETSDDVLQAGYKDLVYALAHSHWVIVKLQSTRGINHVKMLGDGQREDFANTLALYRLLGGTL